MTVRASCTANGIEMRQRPFVTVHSTPRLADGSGAWRNVVSYNSLIAVTALPRSSILFAIPRLRIAVSLFCSVQWFIQAFVMQIYLLLVEIRSLRAWICQGRNLILKHTKKQQETSEVILEREFFAETTFGRKASFNIVASQDRWVGTWLPISPLIRLHTPLLPG